MELFEKKCISLDKSVKALNEDSANKLLKEVSGWQMLDGASLLVREYEFDNYKDAFELVTKISEIAEEENHHPDISFGWGYCIVTLQTHFLNGLHENDFIIAAKINKLGN